MPTTRTTETIKTMLSSVEGNVLARCGSKSAFEDRERDHAKRQMMEKAARGKSAKWGPTHSLDSDDSSAREARTRKVITETMHNGNMTQTTKEETVSSAEHSPTRPAFPVAFPEQTTFERMFESATSAVDSFVKSATKRVQLTPKQSSSSPLPEVTKTPQSESSKESGRSTLQRHADMFAVFMEDACSPCSQSTADDDLPEPYHVPPEMPIRTREANLGISPLISPKEEEEPLEEVHRAQSSNSSDSPVSRRLRRHKERQRRAAAPPPPPGSPKQMPLKTLTVKDLDPHDISRSISELTMKSSYGEATAKLSDSRRMAYYAVGKHHKNSGRGGNRRCYFSGKLILGGAPFYAGSVQQGLRTLVVFCLPSAIGLPKGVELRRQESHSTNAESVVTRESSIGVEALPRTLKEATLKKSRISSGLSNNNSSSRLSSLDDMSLSLEEDIDPNWGIDREYLLQVLPEPSQNLLDEMSVRYPEQFNTLPVQVKSQHCWRLFIKFCFFSGLPIAEGELHYKVTDHVAQDVYGEEIVLSHEVMEAVNGESAEILRLPNQKTFKYLRKHYTQQSGKLSEAVFQRTSWEIVLPEV